MYVEDDIIPNVVHVTTSTESIFVSSTIPSQLATDSEIISHCPAMHVLVCLWIGLLACMYDVFVYPLSSELCDDCRNPWAFFEREMQCAWTQEHLGLVWQLHHSVVGLAITWTFLHAFLEGIEILLTITKKSVLYGVLCFQTMSLHLDLVRNSPERQPPPGRRRSLRWTGTHARTRS